MNKTLHEITLREIECEIQDWGVGRLSDVTPYAQEMKVAEELLEIVKAVNRSDGAELVDAIGDSFIALVNLAHKYQLTLGYCYRQAFNAIKEREGKVINNQYVKQLA